MKKYQPDPNTHKINEFGFIDYKKPLNKQQDMRTSTYLGHKYMNDTMLGKTLHANIKESRPYTDDPLLDKQRTSDYKANFLWKFNDPDDIRNPTLDKILFIKPFYECKIKFLKRPMLPACSVTQSDYIWRPEEPKATLPAMPIQSAVTAKKVTMDHSKTGYSKYLDTSATTSRLDFCHRTEKDIMGGIGANDNITYWNWQAMERRTKRVYRDPDPQQCDKVASNECTKRRCEFTSLVKAVPNSGLTTEVRDNYVEPYKRATDYDASQIRNLLTFVEVDASQTKTDYGILGSGECTNKYV